MFSARVICDSLAPNYRRGVSMVVTMPQMIEQEFLRHRVMCCSFSSTRAIPINLQLQARAADEGHMKSGPMHGFDTFRSMIDTGATIETGLNVYDLRRLVETYELLNPLLAL